MLKKFSLTLFLFALLVQSSTAQEVWSLEKCIDYAYQNSIDAKRADINVKNAELTERGNKLSRLPNLNLSANYSLSFGRNIDIATNEFTTQSIGTNNFTLSSGVTLYNGNRITNSIKQSKIDTKAAQADAQQIERDLALNVAVSYLNVLLSKEQLENSQKRLVQSKDQLTQTDRLIKAGTRPEGDRYEILAQIARDEQLIVSGENTVIRNYLSLKQLLLLEPDFDLEVVTPNIENIAAATGAELDQLSLSNTYDKAVNNQPRIEANNLRLKSAELGVKIAKAGWYPSIQLFGQLDSRFSSQGKAIDEIIPVIDETDARVNGIPVVIETLGARTTLKDNPYFKQLDENLGYGFGVSLSMPLYQNGVTRIAVERAKLNIITNQLQTTEFKQNLKSQLQQAIADAKAARKTFASSERTLDANKISFTNTEKRYRLGAVNTFEYTTARNTLDQSEIDYTLAKYEYVFRMKIVDYYLGKDLTIKE